MYMKQIETMIKEINLPEETLTKCCIITDIAKARRAMSKPPLDTPEFYHLLDTPLRELEQIEENIYLQLELYTIRRDQMPDINP